MKPARRGAPTPGPDPLVVLEREPLRPYYFLYGEETFLVERALASLRARLVAPRNGDGARVVWGDDDPERLADALADLTAPSLFGGASVLVLRRADALAAAQEDAVLALLPRLGEGARLVLVARAMDQRRRLAAACAKAGAVFGLARIADARAAAAWVVRLARERDHVIATEAVEEIVERVGLDLARLDDEVEKLALHVGPGQSIGLRHVRALVAATRAHAVEELTDRLARQDTAGALRTLRGLLAAGEPPIRIVAFLSANLRRALHVTELLASGLGEDDVAARLGMPTWLVARGARRGSPAGLERALVALRDLDSALKSSRPEAASFERVLLEMGATAPAR